MTVEDVARYGVKKLGIATAKGFELSALTGYLAAVKPKRPAPAMDSGKPSGASGAIDQYLKGE